jgi:hypothetical protein
VPARSARDVSVGATLRRRNRARHCDRRLRARRRSRFRTRAKAAGFATLALAADLAAAKALLAEGATRVVLHPGPATPDKRANKTAAAVIDAACAALKGAPVLVHRAAGYDTALDAACAKARGVVLPLQPSMP